MNRETRVRFAPSPTGVLHIGGVRTALYNYLFAKKNGGKFILRIEDTDQSRFVPGAEEYIKSSLKWCGISWDEGPDVGGRFAPYRQSERKDMYKKYALQMIEEGTAYYAFDTAEDLEEMREKLKEAKANSLNYNSITRTSMKNSLTLSSQEVADKLNSDEPYVIRIKVPAKEDIRLNDLVRGWVNVHSSTIDDKVLMKSDGMPTYHLANVVDDYLMGISHVIRGEEWLPSAPLHVLLYKYLGWEESMPIFAHLPLLLKPDGNGKLSKRDAAKHGFPIFPLAWQGEGEDAELKGFKEEGYLPAAFVNFLSLLGWNPGTENEIFSLSELVESFTTDGINKSGAKFDIQKAIWFNQQYLHEMSIDLLAKEVKHYASLEDLICSDKKAAAIAELMRERIDLLPELISKGRYFFEAPSTYDQKVVSKKWNDTAKTFFLDLKNNLSNLSDLSSEAFQDNFNTVWAKNETHSGTVMQILRVAITGEPGGPDLMKIMELIGTKEVCYRIQNAINAFDATS